MTPLQSLAEWLVRYAELPIDKDLVRRAEQKDLPARALLEIGRGIALTAVTAQLHTMLLFETGTDQRAKERRPRRDIVALVRQVESGGQFTAEEVAQKTML